MRMRECVFKRIVHIGEDYEYVSDRVIGLKENKEDAKTGRKKSTIKNSANKKRWYKEEEKRKCRERGKNWILK